MSEAKAEEKEEEEGAHEQKAEPGGPGADVDGTAPKQGQHAEAIPGPPEESASTGTFDVWSVLSVFSPAKPTEQQVEAKVDEAAAKFKGRLRSLKKKKDASDSATISTSAELNKEATTAPDPRQKALDEALVELGDVRKNFEESVKENDRLQAENDRLQASVNDASKDLSAAKAKSLQMEQHIKDITEKESIVKSTTLAFFVLAQLVILGGIIAVVISSEPVGMRLTKQLVLLWEDACDYQRKCPVQNTEAPGIGLMAYLFS